MGFFKKAAAALCVALCFAFSGCLNMGGGEGPNTPANPPDGPIEPPETSKVVTSVKKTAEGRVYVDYLGAPFPFVGGQIRTDGLMNRGEGAHAPVAGAPAALSALQVEPYIQKAAEFGLNCVQIPLDWRDVEPQKDAYDFSVLDTFMQLCVKHNIKMEILWFSTNMCGDTHSFHLPDYLYGQEYEKLGSAYNYFNWMYGNVSHFRMDGSALMEREAKVLKAMMDHVYEWNNANGKGYPVISVQVHNEADGLTRWRAADDQAKLSALNGMTRAQLWQMTLSALDNAGRAVKSGAYKVVTRCNMTVSFSMDDFAEAPGCSPKQVYELEGIDIVGDDPYTTSVAAITSTINRYTYKDNYPHIAENMGSYDNTASLILAAVTAGGGYNIYDFATPEYFTFMNEYNGSSYQMDQGVLSGDLTDKPHSQSVRDTVKGVGKAQYLLATAPLSSIAGFNLDSDRPKASFSRLYELGGKSLTFTTRDGALGFAVLYENYVVLYATAAAEAAMNFDIARVAYSGVFGANGSFASDNQKSYPAGNTLALKKNTLYRVELV